VIVPRTWRGLQRIAEAFLVMLVVAMTIACVAQVIWRYLFDDPLTWSEELARYLFIWIGYLSAWLAWKHRAHIALDAVSYLNRPQLERACARIVEVLVLAFCIYTFHVNFTLLALTHSQPSAVLEIPMSYIYAGYSAMAALISLDIIFGWLYGGTLRPAPAEG
jgi:TRAP-type C4-dicarboxylate transport system permease small subunit